METNNCVSVFSVHYCYLSLRVNFNNTFINEHNEKKIIPYILTSKSICLQVFCISFNCWGTFDKVTSDDAK